MRKVHICMEEVATYEFDMEVDADASDEAIAELAEEHFTKIGVAACECEVKAREVSAIDGVTF